MVLRTLLARGCAFARNQASPWLNPCGLGLSTHLGLTTLVERNPQFGQLQPDDVEHFRALLGDAGVVTDSTALEAQNRDWMRKYQGKSQLVLRPASTHEMCQVLKHCHARRLAVVPQGGNTGLVGGGVPVFDEVIIHTARMNKILSFDPAAGVLMAQAGCVLGALDAAIWPQGWIMPLDLGAKGSCHIGGNVSTNAGGLRLLRYGSLHGSVLGVEVALADGRRLDLLRTLRKDNTGYDLKQLFIGAEGTLGVVTAVAIQCAPRPASVQVVFFQLSSYADVIKLLTQARQQLGEILSAFEFLDAQCMDMVCAHLPGVSNPLGDSSQPGTSGNTGSTFYALVETHGSNAEHDMAKLQTFLEDVMSSGKVVNGVVADNEGQAAAIWRVREGIAEALGRRGAVYKYDVSLPVQGMYGLVEDVAQRVSAWGPDVRVLGYGHVGDGNLHLNVSAPKYSDELQAALEPFIYERVAAQAGSISAEHGLGVMKAGCIQYSKSAEAVAIMAELKQLFDPHGILNPYKVLPPAA